MSGSPPGPPGGGDHDGPQGPGGSGGSGGGPGDSGGSGSGGDSGATSGSGPRRPWWRSVPRVAAIAAALVAAVVLIVFLTRPDGGSKADGEVFLQAAGTSGPDPFTESTARESDPEPGTSSPSAVPSATATGSRVTRGVDGAEPGLYGGTRKVGSCDVEKQISALRAAPDKNRAFASVQDVEPSAVPDHLRSLTPVQLRLDTRVTNHGFRDGKATPYQAVLQGGTAVLVDDRGVPRVRCACGNPLLPPVAQGSTPEQKGKAWPGYRASDVVVVEPSSKPVDEFVMVDPENGDWFTRPAGDTGGGDKKTDPPEDASKSSCPPGSGDDPNRSCPPGTGTSPPEGETPSRPDGPSAPPTAPPTGDTPPPDEPPGTPATPEEPRQPQEQQPDSQSAPLPQEPEPEPRSGSLAAVPDNS